MFGIKQFRDGFLWDFGLKDGFPGLGLAGGCDLWGETL